MLLPDSARELITSGALAHLVTVGRDGSPQVTCIWVGLDGDQLVSGHLFEQQKLRNVRRDPRVVLSLEGTRSARPASRNTLSYTGRRSSRRVAHPTCSSGWHTCISGPR